MRPQLLPALRVLLVVTVLCGVVYPLAVLAFGQVVFADQADGSLVRDADGNVVGSSLIGQQFTGPGYFWSRPASSGPLASGTPGTPDAPVDPTDLSLAYSGGSNLGPTNVDLLDAVEERAIAYREGNGLAVDTIIPVDAVTSSGSGVDPHISIANAKLQAPRVATERGLDLADVLALVNENTDDRSVGLLGEPGVNVLALNLALDRPAEPGP